MRHRGFSLIEVAAALTVAGLVVAAATIATVSLQKSFTTARLSAGLLDDVSFTVEYLLRPVRIAGGGRVRPWQALSTSCDDDGRVPLPPCQNGPDGRVTGRLHVAVLEPTQCPIDAVVGDVVTVAKVGGVCCMNAFPAGTSGVVLFPSEDVGRTLPGPMWRARRCTRLRAPLCGCQIEEKNGTPIGVDALVGKAGVTDAQLAGGTIARGKVQSYFVDPDGYLSIYTDLQNTGNGQSTPLVPRVVAFATRHGYDTDVDGVVDPLVADADPSRLDRLRLLRVGLAVAARGADDRETTDVLFGTMVRAPGQRVVAMEGNGVVRATGVFQ